MRDSGAEVYTEILVERHAEMQKLHSRFPVGKENSAEEYEKTMAVIRAQQPVEFTGEGGDVLLCAAPACPSELPC